MPFSRVAQLPAETPRELAAHYDILPDPLLVHVDGIWIYANPAAAKLFGAASAEELIGTETVDTIQPEDRAQAAGGQVTALRRQRLVRPDGSLVDVEATGRPVRTADGRQATLVAMRDISERLAEETRFRVTFEQAAMGIAHIGLDGRWLRVNRRFAEIVGHDYETLIAQTFRDITFPEDRAADERHILACLGGSNETFSTQKRCISANGEVVWIHLTSALARRPDGSPDYFIVVVEDISEQRAAEEKLRASEERFRHLVEYAGELILIIDQTGTVKYASRNAGPLLGYDADEVIGQSALTFIHPDDLPLAVEQLQRVARQPGVRERATVRVRTAGDGWRTFAVTTVNLLDDPSVGGIVVNGQDRTEAIRLQDELAQLRRVESLGRVAASVTHEFNNILAAARAFATVLERKAGPDLLPIVKSLNEALGRGKHVTGEILRYAQPATVTLQEFDVRAWLLALQQELHPLVANRNPLQLDVADDVAVVHADRAQLSQVITNLVLNARDASPPRASITIGARRSDRATVLEVRDEGSGIDPNTLEHLFEPMFTTKKSGTGLGLPIVQQIVLRHGGTLHVASEVGRGATFTIVLP